MAEAAEVRVLSGGAVGKRGLRVSRANDGVMAEQERGYLRAIAIPLRLVALEPGEIGAVSFQLVQPSCQKRMHAGRANCGEIRPQRVAAIGAE